MNNDELFIEIRPSRKEELELLESEFSPNNLSKHHHGRQSVQEKGEGVYLIAWHNDKPIGHFLLRWNGPDKDTSHKYPYPTPYLEGGGTRSAYRRKGVATRLIAAAEKLVAEKGFTKIGMAVGSADNPNAKRLYEKLGFRGWEKGEFTLSWEYLSKENVKGTESEVCIYMFKDL